MFTFLIINRFLFSIGENGHGQLGLGDTRDRSKFEKISNVRFRSVSTGALHTAAIDEKRCLWSCGHNELGQLGLGDTRDRV